MPLDLNPNWLSYARVRVTLERNFLQVGTSGAHFYEDNKESDGHPIVYSDGHLILFIVSWSQ